MKIKLTSLVVFLVLMFYSAGLHAVEVDTNHGNCYNDEKIYVNPEQISITEEGIFALVNDEFIQAAVVSYDDDNQLFFKPILQKGPCGLHNKWCHACGGCGVLFCPMVCCCPFGGGG